MMTEVAIGDNPHNERFTYTSLPRSLYYSSYKNVNDSEKPFYGNVMYDKRVIRGNTWALRRMAQESLVAEEQEDRNSVKQRRNSIRQQIQAKLEAHKKSSLPNVPKRQHPKGLSSKRGAHSKDDFKRNNAQSGYESNAKSSSDSLSDQYEKITADDNMQISDKLNQEDVVVHDSMQIANDVQPNNETESELEISNRQFGEDLSAALIKDHENQHAQSDNDGDTKNFESGTIIGNKIGLDTVTEEAENDLLSSEDLSMKENLSRDQLIKQLLSKSDPTVLYPLPIIESNFSILGGDYTKIDINDNEISLIQLRNDIFDQQIDEALKSIVNDALSGAEKEVLYEMEIEQLRSENDQLREKHEQLIRDYEDVKATVAYQPDSNSDSIFAQRQSLINEYAQLEKEKSKFVSRQIAWELINNEILPVSLKKLIEHGYIGLDDEENEDIIRQKNRVKFEDEEINAQIESSVKDDFMPWLCSEVWGNVAHATMSRLLDDAIDLQNSYCRRNAKNFILSALDSNF